MSQRSSFKSLILYSKAVGRQLPEPKQQSNQLTKTGHNRKPGANWLNTSVSFVKKLKSTQKINKKNNKTSNKNREKNQKIKIKEA